MSEETKKTRRNETGLRRAFVTGLFALTVGSAVLFTFRPVRSPKRAVQPVILPDTSVPFTALNLAASARGNLEREFSAYDKRQSPPLNYYTQLGDLLDADGNVFYGLDTLPLTAPRDSFAYQRGRLGMYLYGDRTSRAENIMGPEALMRVAECDKKGFLTGISLALSLHTQTEEQIHDLLRANGISGGCIVQNTADGRIEVMTATSISADNQSGTLAEALIREKSGLSQLEACIAPEALTCLGLTDAELQDYFSYHALSSVRAVTDGNGQTVPFARFHFMTDFDLLDEGTDGCISPLHLNSVTQRIFAGNRAVPTLIAAYVTETEEGSLREELPPKTGEAIPPDTAARLQAQFPLTATTAGGARITYRQDERAGFVYVTGRIQSADGTKDKCFTLYAHAAPNGQYDRNRCILRLVNCIGHYINAE